MELIGDAEANCFGRVVQMKPGLNGLKREARRKRNRVKDEIEFLNILL